MSTLIRVDDMKKHYGAVRAVDGVSFSVERNTVFGLVGESGSGKTTIGKCVLGLERPTSGEIARSTSKMQMIFQNPYASFNPALTIGAALHEIGAVHKLGKEYQGHLARLLDLVSLTDDVLRRKPKEMSGGQLQRLAIARALLLRPEFIVADEPVSALDVSVQAQVINLLVDLQKEYGLTILFISHDLMVVEYICDYVAVAYLGRVVEAAPCERIFSDPLHPYTKALIAARPRSHPDDEGAKPLKGEIPNAIDLPRGCRFHSRCPMRLSGLCDLIEPVEKEASPGHFVSCHLFREKAEAS